MLEQLKAEGSRYGRGLRLIRREGLVALLEALANLLGFMGFANAGFTDRENFAVLGFKV